MNNYERMTRPGTPAHCEYDYNSIMSLLSDYVGTEKLYRSVIRLKCNLEMRDRRHAARPDTLYGVPTVGGALSHWCFSFTF